MALCAKMSWLDISLTRLLPGHRLSRGCVFLPTIPYGSPVKDNDSTVFRIICAFLYAELLYHSEPVCSIRFAA